MENVSQGVKKSSSYGDVSRTVLMATMGVAGV